MGREVTEDNSNAAALAALSQLFQEYDSLPLPRRGKFDLLEADVDLYECDSYLSGFVDTFLRAKKIPRPSIVLRSSVEDQLNACVPASPEEAAVIAAFKLHRKKMVELAMALSQATEVPIEWWE